MTGIHEWNRTQAELAQVRQEREVLVDQLGRCEERRSRANDTALEAIAERDELLAAVGEHEDEWDECFDTSPPTAERDGALMAALWKSDQRLYAVARRIREGSAIAPPQPR